MFRTYTEDNRMQYKTQIQWLFRTYAIEMMVVSANLLTCVVHT